MQNVMIDLETLDTRPSTYVLSIGACVFGDDGVDTADTFYTSITGEQVGRTMSRSTVQWWLTHPTVSDEARTVFTDPSAVKLPDALRSFHTWLLRRAGTHVWANDPDFDCSILQHALNGVRGIEWPFGYNAGRSFRTVVEDAWGLDHKDHWPARSPELIHHNALHDAIYEAQVVVAARKRVWRRLPPSNIPPV